MLPSSSNESPPGSSDDVERQFATAVRTLFDQAVDLPPEEREEFVFNASDDARLCEQVIELLRELNDMPAGFLTAPGDHRLSEALAPPPVIGPYTLGAILGEGGMGQVYAAEQVTPVRRKVAIKLIKPGLDTAEVLARFEAERDVLARLEHPSIARVLDAGVTIERRLPYFVIELVDGIPLTLFCDQNNVSLEQRLEFFLEVCHALAHAHARGIVHRDVKPSNILAGMRDGKIFVKVIDFGIARAINAEDALQSRLTAVGRPIGTREYMSPEQAEGSLDIDTRSDIFSLGVLLYELLTGSTPTRSGKDGNSTGTSGKSNTRSITVTDEEPYLRPSTSLSTRLTSAEIARTRQSTVQKLVRVLRNDLDWIPMMALRYDRERRYASVLALAEDVENYLAKRPIVARPESQIYRLRKFVQRRKTASVLSAVTVIALVAGSLAATVGLRQARASEAIAIGDRSRAIRQAEFAHERETAARYETAVATLREGAAFTQINRLYSAQQLYETARQELTALGRSTLAADFAMWDLARIANPPIAQFDVSSQKISGLKFSADASTAVAASVDGTLQRIDLRTGKVIAATKFSHAISSLCPVGGSDNQSDDFYILSGANEPSFSWPRGHNPAPTDLGSLRPAGTVSAQSEDGRSIVRLVNGQGEWVTIDKNPIALEGTQTSRLDVVFTDNTHFITGGYNNRIQRWTAGKNKADAELDLGEGITHIALSPDRAKLAVTTWVSLTIVDIASMKIDRRFGENRAVEFDCAWSPDGARIVTGSWDGLVRLWDLRGGKLEGLFRGASSPIERVAFSSDGSRLLAGSWDGKLWLWDRHKVPAFQTTQALPESRWHPQLTSVLGGRIIAATTDTGPVLIDRSTGRILKQFTAYKDATGVSMGATDTELAFACDGAVRLYDLAADKEVAILGDVDSPGSQIYIWRASGAPRLAAWNRRRGTLTLWDLATQKPLLNYVRGDLTWQFAISALGDWAVDLTATAARGIERYGLDGREPLTRPRDLGFDASANAVFSPDGNRLVTRSNSQQALAQVWTTADMKVERTIPDSDSAIIADLFWPDGEHLLSTSVSYDLLLRDFHTGEILYTASHGAYASPELRGVVPTEGPTNDIVLLPDNPVGILNTSWPLQRQSLEPAVRTAMVTLRDKPIDAASLETLGRWYALHGADDWAAECLLKAKATGKAIDSVMVAQTLVRAGQLKPARVLFESALVDADDSALKSYLKLWLSSAPN